MIKEQYKGSTIHLKNRKVVVDDLLKSDIKEIKALGLEYILEEKKVKPFKGVKEDED